MKSASHFFTIHDLPLEERPRERLIEHGPQALSSQELLALILGRGISGESIMTTSQKMIAQFGSLAALSDASVEDLCAIRGIGLAKAAQLKACFEIAKRIKPISSSRKSKMIISPQEIAELVRNKLRDFSKEHFFVVSLDARSKVVGIDTVSIGALNASIVHPRETFDTAIRRHAAYIMLSHNHPSGEADPSEEDIAITKRLKEAGSILGIPLVDHIIVTKQSYYSLLENKNM